MITSTDDGRVRTHDDAQALLRYAVPGAELSVWRLPYHDSARERARSYSLRIRRASMGDSPRDLVVLGTYALPARADLLLKDALDRVAKLTQP